MILLAIPEPMASVHSDSPNPILSRSFPTLTCTVEMNSTIIVNVLVTVSMEWTEPDGTASIPATKPHLPINFLASILLSLQILAWRLHMYSEN